MIEENKKGYIKHFLIAGLYSIICGFITGIIIFIFKFIAKNIEEVSIHLLSKARISFIGVMITLIVLAVLATLMYLLQKKVPEIKGGGIPKSEGVLRGIFRLRGLKTLIGTLFGSMLSYMAGVPVGTEGPSVLIGTSAGIICNKTSKKHKALERYIGTSGAAAGFAVATGAPFSGILFALEEIHKRFTPMLVVTTSLAVLSATFVNITLCNIFDISPNLFVFTSNIVFEYKDIIYFVILGLLIALIVGIFDKTIGLIFKLSSKKIIKIHPLFKLIIIFIISGLLGMYFIECVYSGHDIIQSLISTDIDNFTIIMLLAILLIRFIFMFLVIDSGVTGGIFIPTMAIAAVIGVLFGKLLLLIGMDESYVPVIIILTMCAFIGGTLRAPFTAAIFFVELTGSFNNIFYIILVIFIVNFIVEIFDQPSFYDRTLEKMHAEIKEEETVEYCTVIVSENSFVVGKSIRDIMWPHCLVLLKIERCSENYEKLNSDGETKIYANDKISFRCAFSNEKEFLEDIYSLVGNTNLTKFEE